MNHTIAFDQALDGLSPLPKGDPAPRANGFDTGQSRFSIPNDNGRNFTEKPNKDENHSLNGHRTDSTGGPCATTEIARTTGSGADDVVPIGIEPARVMGAAPATEAPASNADQSSVDPKETVAQTLMRLASRARLLRGVDGRFYASVPIGDRTECLELRSSRFERWLKRAYRQEGNLYPPAETLKGVIGLLEADAEQDGAIETACLRVGAGGGLGAPIGSTYYIDLGDRARHAILIGPGFWDIVDRPAVQFHRPDGLAAFPIPIRGGSIELLKDFVNVADAEFLLLIAWLTAALRAVGPYPVLFLIGEQGSAKSTLARVARLLVDPHSALLRAEPESRRDFMVGAVNNWMLAYDNVSKIPNWLSDGLCRLATGASFAARKLFENDLERHWTVRRPVMINGIGDLARQEDLVDRSLFLNLPPITEEKRQYEEEFWASFERDYPRLLGALLDAIAEALRILPEVELESRPRMADFARWGEAVSRALGQKPGTFLAAYSTNRQVATSAALEESPVARAVLRLLARSGGAWKGTATELLALLTSIVRDPITDIRRWPKSPLWLSQQLRRVAPQLRSIGINVTFDRGNSRREIRIYRRELLRKAASSAPPTGPARNHESPPVSQPKGA